MYVLSNDRPSPAIAGGAVDAAARIKLRSATMLPITRTEEGSLSETLHALQEVGESNGEGES
jgi:hypothetical protein